MEYETGLIVKISLHRHIQPWTTVFNSMVITRHPSNLPLSFHSSWWGDSIDTKTHGVAMPPHTNRGAGACVQRSFSLRSCCHQYSRRVFAFNFRCLPYSSTNLLSSIQLLSIVTSHFLALVTRFRKSCFSHDRFTLSLSRLPYDGSILSLRQDLQFYGTLFNFSLLFLSLVLPSFTLLSSWRRLSRHCPWHPHIHRRAFNLTTAEYLASLLLRNLANVE